MSKVLSKKFLLFLLILLGFLLIAITVSFSRFPSKEPSLVHAPDYSWVIGRLEYNPIEGGFWQIRFGEENDPYRGLFVLDNDSKLQNLKDGDLIKITGKILENQASFYQAGTLYQIESIQKLRQ